MDLRQLRTFVVVAEAGGFAAAQQQLRLSQPAASRQIQALEGELGIPLFDRVGRGIKLTSEGEDLLRRGRRLLQDAESFGERARALRTGKAGTLRVGCSTQHMETVLANFLPTFRRKHPSVVIELIEDGGARVPDRLQRGDVHLAIIPAADDGYHRRLLAPVHMLAAVSPRHGFASRRKLEIADAAIGSVPMGGRYRPRDVEGFLEQLSKVLEIRVGEKRSAFGDVVALRIHAARPANEPAGRK